MARLGPSPAAITPLEAKLLEFLGAQVKAHGFAPTLDEMRAATGLKAASNIHRALHELERKGKVRIMPRRARAIELVKPIDHHIGDCLCASCNPARYGQTLKLVDAIKNDAPAHLRFTKKSNVKRMKVPNWSCAMEGIS